MQVVVGGFGGNTVAFGALDSRTGALQLRTYSDVAGPHPDFFAWVKKGDALHALVANEAGDKAAITALQLQRQPAANASSALKAVKVASLRVDDPCHVAVHPSNRWAFSASYPAGTVTVLELLHMTSFQQGSLKSAAAAAVQAAPAASGSPWLLLRKASVLSVGEAAHEVALAGPGGNLVYVPCLKSNYIRMYTFDAATGSLAANNYPGNPAGSSKTGMGHQQQTTVGPGPSSTTTSTTSTTTSGKRAIPSSSSPSRPSVQPGDNRVYLPPGSGPRHIVFHPRLPVAFVLNELGNTIIRFDWDAESGGHLLANFAAQPGRIVSMLPPGASCRSPSSELPDDACKGQQCLQAGGELLLSADGRFLYASNRGSCGGLNNIAIFAVSATDGSLTAIGWEDGGGDINFPRHMSLTPDNAFLLVANQHRGSVTVLKRDEESGLLSKEMTVPAAAADGSAAVVEPAFVVVVPW